MARNFKRLSLQLPLGTTWEEEWELLQSAGGPAVDLTGYSARMHIREYIDDAAPLATLATGSGITIVALSGIIRLRMEATAVDALSPANERKSLVWDVELYQPGPPEYVIPLFRGSLTVTPRVTR